uniref:Uncharacterized protein n=1 Tax=Romanomermis culicivorax TaxID=13658 RepID=A0A915IYK9_ROMCU
MTKILTRPGTRPRDSMRTTVEMKFMAKPMDEKMIIRVVGKTSHLLGVLSSMGCVKLSYEEAYCMLQERTFSQVMHSTLLAPLNDSMATLLTLVSSRHTESS